MQGKYRGFGRGNFGYTHRIGGNRERSLIFRKIVKRLPNKAFSIAKTAIDELKLDVFDCHYIDFGNRKRKIVYNSAFTIAAYPVCDIGQGKIRKKSGNFPFLNLWEPCLINNSSC